jgi:hypothetical protein
MRMILQNWLMTTSSLVSSTEATLKASAPFLLCRIGNEKRLCADLHILHRRQAGGYGSLLPLELDSSLKRDHPWRCVSSESHAKQPGRR